MENEKIVVMYRVKNEERWIKQSIESIYDLCSEIVILDDGSTDKTGEIYSKFDKVTDVYFQENEPLDEVRDRNKLLEMGLKTNPDILFSLDGDEILMPNAQSILTEELDVLHPNSKVFSFQFLTFWDSLEQIRYDGYAGNFWQPRLFRVSDQPKNLKFEPTELNGNLHGGSLPTNTIGLNYPVRSNVKIFHCASIDEKIRKRKYDWYNTIDKNNLNTDCYIHMIGGEGRFSGPNGVELKPTPSDLFIDT